MAVQETEVKLRLSPTICGYQDGRGESVTAARTVAFGVM